MNYTTIVTLINKKIPSEQLNLDRMLSFMDEVIDDINAQLGAQFPTFTEHNENVNNTPNEYTYFPDRYIRTVVVSGAAAKWYTADEEGIETATTYVRDYNNALFLMLRDFSYEFLTNPEYERWRVENVGAIPDYSPAAGISFYNPMTGRRVGVNKQQPITIDELTGDEWKHNL